MRAIIRGAFAATLVWSVSACFDFGDLGGAEEGDGGSSTSSETSDDASTVDAGSTTRDGGADGESEIDAGCTTLFEGVCNGNAATQVVFGGEQECALLKSGTVWCWGGNAFGQMGKTPDMSTPYAPTEIPGLDHVIQIASGEANVCALRDDTYQRSVWCWGENIEGELGHDPSLDPPCSSGAPCSITPTKVGTLAFVQQIAVAGRWGCAVTATGQLYCWGDNSEGQLGPNIDGGATTPTLVFNYSGTPPTLSAGSYFSCFANGSVSCRGGNPDGELGHPAGTLGDGPAPNYPNAGTHTIVNEAGAPIPMSNVSLGYDHGCGIVGDGGVTCWGLLQKKIKFTDPNPDASPPTLVVSGGIAQVATEYDHTCTRAKNGDVSCWGKNDYGMLGLPDGSITAPGIPVFNAASVAVGPEGTLAIAADGSVWGWGYSAAFDGGTSQGGSSKTPTRIPGLP